MKKLFTIILSISAFLSFAQVPQGINYQAVIRNSSGAIATNSMVILKFELYNSSALSPLAYGEAHNALSTGTTGIVTCTIGNGIPSTGTFSTSVNWAGGDVWYKVFLNMGSSGTQQIGGAQKFMTVPYAFYAGMAPTTLSVSLASGGTNLYSVGGNSVFIAAATSTASSASSTITGQGIAVVSPTSGATFTVNVPAPTLTITGGNILKLTQGSATTSITLPGGGGLWSNTGNYLYPTGSPSVGIGTSTPNNLFQVKNYLKMEDNGSNIEMGLSANSGTTSSGTGNFYNTSIGYYAGSATTNSAAGNTFIGYGTGQYNTTGYNNTALGTAAGNSITVGYNNTFLGNKANGTSSTIYNAVAIGNNAKVGQNSAIVLGDYSDNNLRVSIGRNPSIPLVHKLDVEESSSASGIYAAIRGISTGSSTSIDAHGIFGSTNSTQSLAAGVYGQNIGNGSAIFGNKTSGLTGNAGRFILSVPSSTSAAVYAQSQSSSTLSAAVWGHNPNNGIGVYGDGNNGVGVFGSSATNSGVYGVSNSGDAGKFILPIASNGANAVHAETNGTGAAVYAKSWNANPIAGQFIGDVTVKGKTLTDSIQISGSGTPAPGAVLVSRDNLGNGKWSGSIGFKGSFAPASGIPIASVAGFFIGGNLAFSTATTYNNCPSGYGISFNNFNVQFRAHEKGMYHFDASLMVTIQASGTGNNYIAYEIYNNTTGVVIARTMQNNPDNNTVFNTVLVLSTDAEVNANDVIVLRVMGSLGSTVGSISNTFAGTSSMNLFSGHLIR